MNEFERHPTEDLESALVRERPAPPAELRRRLDARIQEQRRVERRYAGARLSFAAALTVFMLGSFASVGGLGYAANGARDALRAVKDAVVPSERDALRRLTGSSGQLQYGPDNIPICHRVGPGDFVIITIPREELEQHLAHGDRTLEAGQCPTIRVETERSPPRERRPLERTQRIERLPFTGAGLAATAAVALGLLGLGLALRRGARSSVRE